MTCSSPPVGPGLIWMRAGGHTCSPTMPTAAPALSRCAAEAGGDGWELVELPAGCAGYLTGAGLTAFTLLAKGPVAWHSLQGASTALWTFAAMPLGMQLALIHSRSNNDYESNSGRRAA